MLGARFSLLCELRVWWRGLTFRLKLSDEVADTQVACDGVQGGLGSLMHLKQAHPHLSVVLSIGGGNSSEIFPIVASNTLLRDNFGRSARGLVEASGLDGIASGTSISSSSLPLPPCNNDFETRR